MRSSDEFQPATADDLSWESICDCSSSPTLQHVLLTRVLHVQPHAPPVSFAPPAAVPPPAPLGYRGSLGRDTDLLPLGYNAMRAAGLATSEVRCS